MSGNGQMERPTLRVAISVQQAARMLKVSRSSVMRYLEDGTLEGFQYRPNGWWHIYLDSVLSLRERASQAAAAGVPR